MTRSPSRLGSTRWPTAFGPPGRGGWGRDGLVYVLGIESEAEATHPPDDSSGPDTLELRELVARDHLTGTANRRTFEDALDAQLERCRREGLSLSVALVDLDRFKQYNDTFGHLAGDHCLVTVARAHPAASITNRRARRAASEATSSSCMWPGIDVATAQRNANRIRDSVRVLDLRIADKPMHVSVSIGGITIVPSAETTATALVHAADRAMYAVKRTGGDDTRWVTDPAQVHEGETTRALGRLVQLDPVAGGIGEERLPSRPDRRRVRHVDAGVAQLVDGGIEVGHLPARSAGHRRAAAAPG